MHINDKTSQGSERGGGGEQEDRQTMNRHRMLRVSNIRVQKHRKTHTEASTAHHWSEERSQTYAEVSTFMDRISFYWK